MMRRSMVGRPIMGHWLRHWKATVSRHKGLGFGIERMAIEAPRYWMLALGVRRICSWR
jgi:hypothetical protein